MRIPGATGHLHTRSLAFFSSDFSLREWSPYLGQRGKHSSRSELRRSLFRDFYLIFSKWL